MCNAVESSLVPATFDMFECSRSLLWRRAPPARALVFDQILLYMLRETYFRCQNPANTPRTSTPHKASDRKDLASLITIGSRYLYYYCIIVCSRFQHAQLNIAALRS